MFKLLNIKYWGSVLPLQVTWVAAEPFRTIHANLQSRMSTTGKKLIQKWCGYIYTETSLDQPSYPTRSPITCDVIERGRKTVMSRPVETSTSMQKSPQIYFCKKKKGKSLNLPSSRTWSMYGHLLVRLTDPLHKLCMTRSQVGLVADAPTCPCRWNRIKERDCLLIAWGD